MSNQTLVSTVFNVLSQPQLWKINFELNGLLVTGVRFSMVAAAVLQGTIGCESRDSFTPSPGQALPAGSKIGAIYESPIDLMLFPRDDFGKDNVFEKSVILHEATHAMFDLFAKTGNDEVLAIDDESAAVLVQALFMRLLNDNKGAIHRFSMMIDGSGEHALKLADKMMSETGDFEKNRRTYTLKSEQTKDLRAAVAKDWGFTRRNDPDGGYTDSSGIRYIYDGVTCRSCWGGAQKAGASLRTGTKIN